MFKSFFIGGFECSTHRTRSGRRLDVIASSAHDKHALADYAALLRQGIRSVREGIRWHLIERSPGSYDFTSVLPMLRASSRTGVEVIWDLCHYGWPDDIDVFGPEFVRRFAGLARAFARVLADETDSAPFIAPINEISFFAWAGGEVGYFYPFAKAQGDRLKAQLVRAAIEGVEAVWAVTPRARIVHTDPVIHVVASSDREDDRMAAESYGQAQYRSWDMLAGRLCPELGGGERYLDIIGVNYYPHNQWIHGSAPFNPAAAIGREDPRYRPFSMILGEVYERYGRPILISETGAEADRRPGWLRYVSSEVGSALRAGVPIEGLCWYPIVNHPGWDDDRHCLNGLWDYPDERGRRKIYGPLAGEMRRQRRYIESLPRS
jgi:hypothetical protein